MLTRQLRRCGASPDQPPTESSWTRLLQRIDRHYTSTEEHRYVLERSLDVSSAEMQQLHEAIDWERSQLAAIVTALPQAVLLLDEQRRIRISNPSARHILGQTPTTGAHVDEVLSFHVVGRVIALDRLPHRPPAGSVEVERADGSRVPVDVTQGALDGGTLVTLVDLRQRLLEQAELHDARVHAEVAQRTERARASFLARVSHELRTPLNAILGYSELLLDDAEPGTDTHDIVRIRTAGKHLLGLINDVLDLAKIDAGRMEVRLVPVELDALLREVCDTLRPLADRQATKLVIDCELAQAETDAGKLRQCLYNLVGNAIRHTTNGEVVVRARARSGRLLVEVIDDGEGIPPSSLPTLFEPFTHAPGAQQGTGLGLSLVRSIAQHLGGEVSARSEVGVGSTFTLTLPLRSEGPSEGDAHHGHHEEQQVQR